MLATIREFLSQKRIAIAGVSRRANDFSRMLLREFRDRGYDVVVVNPSATAIDGVPSYARVQDIQPVVENVLLMTPPAATGTVARDCAAAGVKRIWMYRAGGTGAVSAEAVAFCRERGIAVIPGECPMMFLPGGSWVHRAHGWVRKIGGRYPR
jgi:uncharacterized protein